MAWSLVQATDVSTSSSVHSKAFGSNVTAGNLLVAVVDYYVTTGGSPGTFSDSSGATWSTALSAHVFTDAADTVTIAWAVALSSGANTISWTTGQTGEGYIMEFSGVPSGVGLDGTAQTNQGTTGTTGAITLASGYTANFANDLLVGYATINAALTVTSPWSAAATVSGDGGTGYYAPGATGSYNPAWTQSTSNSWGLAVVAFGAAAASAASGPFPVYQPRKRYGPYHHGPLWPLQQPYGAVAQQPPAGVWLPATTFSAPRNRSFFAVRGKQGKPIPPQDAPIVPQRSPAVRREPAKQPRGRQSFPTPPQIPVPPTIPGNRQPAGRRWDAPARGKRWLPTPPQETPVWPLRIETARSKIAALRKGKQVTPVPAQIPVPPTIPGNRFSSLARRLFALEPRGKRTLPVQPQIPVPPTIPGNRAGRWRWAALRRGRGTNPVLTQASTLPPPYPPPKLGAPRRLLSIGTRGKQWTPTPAQDNRPPKLGAPRRLLSVGTRGRRWLPTPPQIAVPKPVFPNRTPAIRRLVPGTRGRRTFPPQPQTAVPPTICYPTAALIVSYQSQPTIPSHNTAIVIPPHDTTLVLPFRTATTVVIPGHDTATTIPPHDTRTTVPPHDTTDGLVNYQSGVPHFNTCND